MLCISTAYLPQSQPPTCTPVTVYERFYPTTCALNLENLSSVIQTSTTSYDTLLIPFCRLMFLTTTLPSSFKLLACVPPHG